MSRVLNESALRDAGIEIIEELVTLEQLKKECPQARILAQYLLDFRHIIANERWKELGEQTAGVSKEEKNHIRIPERRPGLDAHDSTKESFQDRYNITRCDENFDIAATVKKEADWINSEDESRWTEVIADTVFKRLMKKARKGESDKFKPKPNEVIKRFRVERDHTWKHGRDVLALYSQQAPELKAPKPDLFLSFHAYEQGDSECGPLNGEDYVENFGMTRLNELYEDYTFLAKKHPDRKFGFNPSPCTDFYSLSVKARTCFPWAVCEWKHHGHLDTRYEDYLHCQAANAAAVCLTLFANAAAGGREHPILDEIRPVLCMTFTGPRIKVWIAYVTEVKAGRYRYRMRCIWRGSLLNVLDNIKLCVIIENLHFWAMNHLRPWLSGCINQWKRTIDEVREVEHTRSEAAKTTNKMNFALWRANTLDTCLDQDEDYVHNDDSEDSEDDEYKDAEYTEDDEEEDDGEDDVDGWEDEDEEEREGNIDKALTQLERSLRGDKRGMRALGLLLESLGVLR
ncbi:hypothetical protein P171DRAFT_437215 [Karstenula rhodostoma CBS 690.94]|uniref:Uncharacterized protein n=1 Tax=Karstenula rhodostoma CBS 690.94 TaxID=1392251 RepID=A0A9P4U5L1_9PLEO|nr:hypothetical protein P171DRAFT_437215 [Karstenula rhodostoma CBS 690.94]